MAGRALDLSDPSTSRVVHLAVAAVVVACFSPGLGNYFAGDDFNFIFLAVKVIHLPGELLVPVAGFLRPTETLYFIANLLLAGVSPVVYQASSLLIHVLNFLLVSAFIARLSGSRASGLIGATFWALHFRLAEAVLRPSAIPDPLALLFGLSAVLLLLGGRRGWAAAAFAAALLSKENAVILLPLACLLLAMRGRRWLRETLPLWLLAAVYVGCEVAVRSRGHLYFQLDWRAASRFWDVVLGFIGPDMTNVGQVLLGGRLPVVPLWLAVVLFAALAIAIWRAREPYRFALIWIVVTTLPTVFLGHQGSRYTYVPLVGVGMIVGEAGRSLWATTTRRYQRGAILAVATAVALVFVVGINLAASGYAYLGELHRQAVGSFRREVLPAMLIDRAQVVVFVQGDTRVWRERVYARLLSVPWYFPVTYTWLYPRPLGVLGMTDTAAFATACALGRTPTPLFAAVSPDELRRALASGRFLVAVHHEDSNTFSLGSDRLRSAVSVAAAREDLSLRLQPGRFDPTFRGDLHP